MSLKRSSGVLAGVVCLAAAWMTIIIPVTSTPAAADTRSVALDMPERVTTLEGSQVGVEQSQVPIVAGDRIVNPNTGVSCTVGGVLEPSYTDLVRSVGLRAGTRWLFTAGHCGRVGDNIYTSAGHVFLGRVDANHHTGNSGSEHDFMTILVPPTLSGTNLLCPPGSGVAQCVGGNLRFTPRAMSGVANCGESQFSLNNSSRSISGVATAVPSATGVSACGARSGFWRAGILIDAPQPGTALHGTIDALLDPLLVPGDSGGPLYTRLGDNTYRLIGILAAGRLVRRGQLTIDRYVTVDDEIRQTGHVFVPR